MFPCEGDLCVPRSASGDGRYRTFEQGLDEPRATLFEVRDLTSIASSLTRWTSVIWSHERAPSIRSMQSGKPRISSMVKPVAIMR
jgi:hypothetical protein